MTAPAGGLTHDLAPLSAGHRLGEVIGPTLVMTPGTIHWMTATTGEAAIDLSLGAFHQGGGGAIQTECHLGQGGEVQGRATRVVFHQGAGGEATLGAFPPYQGGTRGGVFLGTAIGGAGVGAHGPGLFQGLLLLLGQLHLRPERA